MNTRPVVKHFALITCVLSCLWFVALPALVMPGCTTSQQRITFATIGTVQGVTVAAYDGYIDCIIKGGCRTNDLPRVVVRFNAFQAASMVAIDAARMNTNALAPESLQLLSQDIINLIAAIKKGTK